MSWGLFVFGVLLCYVVGFVDGIMPISRRRLVDILCSIGPEFTVDDLVSRVGLASSTARKYLRAMVKEGLVECSEDRCFVTEEGLLAIEGVSIAGREVDQGLSYVFTDENGAPIPLRVNSVLKLYIAIKYKLIPEEVVSIHLNKGYLANWLKDVVKAENLAKKITNVKTTEELLNTLRKYLPPRDT